MKRSDIKPMPEYFDRYINLVKDKELVQAFEDSLEDIYDMIEMSNEEKGDYKYADGKWTLKEMTQHLIDCERIFSYRTLLFARKDKTMPAGFDQDLHVANSKANSRTIESLMKELRLLRLSTIEMFQSFDEITLLNTGINWKFEMSVLAMGFFIIGHQAHHFNIIKTKYLDHKIS